MSLFGLLGVQLFGQIEKHCVVKGTKLEEITVNSLAIPDTHCSGHPEYGNQCPPDMECMELHLDKEVVGYNGFDHIGELVSIAGRRIFSLPKKANFRFPALQATVFISSTRPPRRRAGRTSCTPPLTTIQPGRWPPTSSV